LFFVGVKELVNLCLPISSGLHRPVAIEIHDHQRLMDPSQHHTTLTIDDQQEDDEWGISHFLFVVSVCFPRKLASLNLCPTF
jgi:hypothetical protein